ncbi:hypothetical protein ISS312_02411 [Alteromonas mediterranea]|nr:hypothetical protein ISS312_02411 [Alteromonas mediterranea]
MIGLTRIRNERLQKEREKILLLSNTKFSFIIT